MYLNRRSKVNVPTSEYLRAGDGTCPESMCIGTRINSYRDCTCRWVNRAGTCSRATDVDSLIQHYGLAEQNSPPEIPYSGMPLHADLLRRRTIERSPGQGNGIVNCFRFCPSFRLTADAWDLDVDTLLFSEMLNAFQQAFPSSTAAFPTTKW